MTTRQIGARLLVAATALSLGACGPKPSGGSAMPNKATVTRAPFGTAPDGKAVELFTLTGSTGIEVRVMTYGGVIVSLRAPDRTGVLDDIVLGYDSLAGYVRNSPYFGAIVGRYGNRIAKGRFTLDGESYKLAANNGPNALHGGLRGFDKVVWGAEPITQGNVVGVKLTYTSADGEEGYPGTLQASVFYTLSGNDLSVEYQATTDKATPVNLTQHTYFNLAGAGKSDILGHVLRINADHYTPVDSTLIPTGEIAPVAGTPFDFRTETAIGARIDRQDPQLKNGGGYDHNFVLNGTGGETPPLAAHVIDPVTGRVLHVFTTEPGVQFYTGNFLDGKIVGKGGRTYLRRYGFCLETQHFPDSPHHANFPSTILRPGAQYRSSTVFRFTVEAKTKLAPTT